MIQNKEYESSRVNAGKVRFIIRPPTLIPSRNRPSARTIRIPPHNPIKLSNLPLILSQLLPQCPKNTPITLFILPPINSCHLISQLIHTINGLLF